LVGLQPYKRNENNQHIFVLSTRRRANRKTNPNTHRKNGCIKARFKENWRELKKTSIKAIINCHSSVTNLQPLTIFFKYLDTLRLGLRTTSEQEKIAKTNITKYNNLLEERQNNNSRKIIPFKKGDDVLLTTRHNVNRKKLDARFTGPYKIEKNYNDHSYEINIPRKDKSRHYSDMKPY
jgi:ribosomal protein L21E